MRGQMVSFDEVKGYGFARPDPGGEDVFVHVNDLGFEKSKLAAGTHVEFDIVEGDRGRKAANVALAETPPARATPARQQVVADAGRTPVDRSELTELLLREVPSLTGEQILAVREVLATVLSS